jgi:hypothetical protein
MMINNQQMKLIIKMIKCKMMIIILILIQVQTIILHQIKSIKISIVTIQLQPLTRNATKEKNLYQEMNKMNQYNITTIIILKHIIYLKNQTQSEKLTQQLLIVITI